MSDSVNNAKVRQAMVEIEAEAKLLAKELRENSSIPKGRLNECQNILDVLEVAQQNNVPGFEEWAAQRIEKFVKRYPPRTQIVVAFQLGMMVVASQADMELDDLNSELDERGWDNPDIN